MKRTLMASVVVLCIAAPTAFAQAAPGNAKPKTAWGAPDIQGFWTTQSLTPMQRAEDVKNLVLTDQEAEKLLYNNRYSQAARQEAGVSKVDAESSAKLLSDKNSSRAYNRFWMDPGSGYAQVKGEYRSSWITSPENGRIPYTTAGISANTRATAFDSYEIRPLPERCLMSFTGSGGPVLGSGMYNNTIQIVQSPDSVMMLAEMIHDVRVIPIFKTATEAQTKHGPGAVPKWGGDSVGWYEGDSLVVETVNSHPKQRSYITPAGKVTERYTRWSDGQVLYEFKVEDPALYTSSWSGEMSLNHSDEPLYEYACHEGNYALPGILAGARKLESEGRPHPVEKPIFAGVDQADGE
ncbi:MAG: hypothetical protein ABL956_17000 [Hyphomonadaceae bacterium]